MKYTAPAGHKFITIPHRDGGEWYLVALRGKDAVFATRGEPLALPDYDARPYSYHNHNIPRSRTITITAATVCERREQLPQRFLPALPRSAPALTWRAIAVNEDSGRVHVAGDVDSATLIKTLPNGAYLLTVDAIENRDRRGKPALDFEAKWKQQEFDRVHGTELAKLHRERTNVRVAGGEIVDTCGFWIDYRVERSCFRVRSDRRGVDAYKIAHSATLDSVCADLLTEVRGNETLASASAPRKIWHIESKIGRLCEGLKKVREPKSRYKALVERIDAHGVVAESRELEYVELQAYVSLDQDDD